MNSILKGVVLALLILLSFGLEAQSEKPQGQELEFEVRKIYPAVSISRTDLQKAERLTDLNANFPSSWVRTYLSIELTTICNGEEVSAESTDDQFTAEQMSLLEDADAHAPISVHVRYLPENNLKDNPPKTFGFECVVNPEKQARFKGGEQALKQYLQQNGLADIPQDAFKEYQLATVKFTVNEQGQVLNPRVFWSSQNEAVDRLLMTLVHNMPDWEPAELAHNIPVQQEYALMVGDMRSCAVHTLNIDPNRIIGR